MARKRELEQLQAEEAEIIQQMAETRATAQPEAAIQAAAVSILGSPAREQIPEAMACMDKLQECLNGLVQYSEARKASMQREQQATEAAQQQEDDGALRNIVGAKEEMYDIDLDEISC